MYLINDLMLIGAILMAPVVLSYIMYKIMDR
jgi:hypothetical protein